MISLLATAQLAEKAVAIVLPMIEAAMKNNVVREANLHIVIGNPTYSEPKPSSLPD